MKKMGFPNFYLFNPTCEYAIANGTPSWQANRILQKMEHDLATLTLFFAEVNDIVIVNEQPSAVFIASLEKIGKKAPAFLLKQNIANKSQHINQLRPWGWSPAAHKLLSPLKDYCSDDFKESPVFNWHVDYKNYYSKKFARRVLHQICEKFPSEHFIDTEQLTQIATTQNEIEQLMHKWGRLMIKAPWSSSGRGLQPIRYKPIHPKVWAKVLAMVKDQGFVIVEPYLNKVIDLAFQFEMKKGKVSYLGISNFSTDYKGQYNGNNLNGLPDSLAPDVVKFIECVPQLTLHAVKKVLENTELATQYEGPFGVDTLIFKDETGKIKVNPCLEINVRHNMGLLCLQLEKYLVNHKKGIFRTWFQPNTSFLAFKNDMEKKHPLTIHNNKIESGFFALSDTKTDTQFGAYLLV